MAAALGPRSPRLPFIRAADTLRQILKGEILLLFDFDRFSRIATNVYNDKNLYSLEDCLRIFKCYFEKYEEFIGHAHPPIKASQISRIMLNMPYIETETSEKRIEELKKIFPEWTPTADIAPEIYPLIIQLHFKTKYRNCDYNINHFFSGWIRDYRILEADKGYK